MKRKLISAMLISTLLLTACGNKQEASKTKEDTSKTASVEVEKDNKEQSDEQSDAPFSKFTAPDVDKKEYNQDILKEADITVINLWGTFCKPCVEEMPAFAELAEEYKDKKVQFIGIVVDALDLKGEYSDSQIDAAKKLMEEAGVKYLNLLPSPDLMESYLSTVQALPETLLVDKDGKILQSSLGGKSKEDLKEIIENQLANLADMK